MEQASARVLREETSAWAPYIEAWRIRLAAEEEERRATAEEMRAAAQRCGKILVRRFGASRVYLFGSLSGRTATPFGPRSDVDLAVEGLVPDRYWEALGAVEAELPRGRHVDLVRLEDAHASLRERVLGSGEVLPG